MYKNQLQELAQRSCFNLPSYACVREGPDHAPRFKATVTFNGESFESPTFCSTLRQAEHAAAEVALNTLSKRGPTQSLAARILDETGVCKNLLQESAQRAGITLPTYITVRSGPGHLPIFTSTVKIAGLSVTGESTKTKKQAEKNAAMAAWDALKQLVAQGGSSSQFSESYANEEQEQLIIARALTSAPTDDKNISVPASQLVHQSSNSESEPRYVEPTSSRIRINRLTESSGAKRAPYDASSSSQSEPRYAGPTASRNRIIPSMESSGRTCTVEPAPCSSTAQFPMNMMVDPSSGQACVPFHQQGKAWVKSGLSSHTVIPHSEQRATGLVANASPSPSISNTASRIAAHVGHTVRQMPIELSTSSLQPAIEQHTGLLSREEDQNDMDEWFETTTSFICTEGYDFNSTDSGLPLQMSYNHMVSMHPDQVMKIEAQYPATTVFEAATCLAPPVRVRQMVPVCSSPLQTSGYEEQKSESKEDTGTWQSLDQLRL